MGAGGETGEGIPRGVGQETEVPSEYDRRLVAELLGREPRGAFQVEVRDSAGRPLVIRNAPLLDDGTPMPTLYWLVGRETRREVDRLEALGGVRQAERAVDPDHLRRAHRSYAAERDNLLPPGWSGPRPSGGVGGTVRGVKCLHAHYAWFLAGGDDPVGRWVADRIASQAPVAAVDCGTNSTRLLVASPAGEPLERLMRITRLGEGVDVAGRLSSGAISRTVAVLEEYRKVIDRHRVGSLRAVATSATRDAANREEFFAAAEAALGVRPELLEGDEEGRLSFVGATDTLDPASGPWLVADIGGGSTELAFGTVAGSPPAWVRSLQVGCVRLTERFLRADPPLPSELAQARALVGDLLEEAAASEPALRQAKTLVGLAGTVSALSAIDQGVAYYERERLHHHVLSRARVEELLQSLASKSVAARRRRVGLEPARADVIVGGAVVLAELMDRFGFGSCLTSEADILDGMVLGLLGRAGSV